MIDGLLAGYILGNSSVFIRKDSYNYRTSFAIIESVAVFVLSLAFWLSLLLMFDSYTSSAGGKTGGWAICAALGYFFTLKSFGKDEYPEFNAGKIFWSIVILCVIWGYSFYSGYTAAENAHQSRQRDSEFNYSAKIKSTQTPQNAVASVEPPSVNYVKTSVSGGTISVSVEDGMLILENGEIMINNMNKADLTALEIRLEYSTPFGERVCSSGSNTSRNISVFQSVPQGISKLPYRRLVLECESTSDALNLLNSGVSVVARPIRIAHN